jgi:hypothetical protein
MKTDDIITILGIFTQFISYTIYCNNEIKNFPQPLVTAATVLRHVVDKCPCSYRRAFKYSLSLTLLYAIRYEFTISKNDDTDEEKAAKKKRQTVFSQAMLLSAFAAYECARNECDKEK